MAATGQLAIDPSRTKTLRDNFCREMRVRFARLGRKITQLVEVEDAFGLRETLGDPFAIVSPLAVNTRWKFNTSSQKLEEFQKWLAVQLEAEIITPPGATVEDWWQKYINAGFEKGAGRAYDDAKRNGIPTDDTSDFYAGSRDQFLRSSFVQPETIEKVKILGGRIFTELTGVTDAMSQGITRALTDGLVQGKSPREIARDLNKSVDGIGRKRAETIARTELIRSHAEGQLNSLEALGVEELGVMVEWNTTGDGRVCPLCVPLDGIVIKTAEARNMLPRHPNCRCAWVPANVGEDQTKQKRTKPAIDAAIDQSVQQEKPKAELEDAKQDSKWVGADAKIAKARPESILDAPAKPNQAEEDRKAAEAKAKAEQEARAAEREKRQGGVKNSDDLREQLRKAKSDAQDLVNSPELVEYTRLERRVRSLESRLRIFPNDDNTAVKADLEQTRKELSALKPIRDKVTTAENEINALNAQIKDRLVANLNDPKNVLEEIRKKVLAEDKRVRKPAEERKAAIEAFNKQAEADHIALDADFKSKKITLDEWKARRNELYKRESEFIAEADASLEKLKALKDQQRGRIEGVLSLPQENRADLVAVKRDNTTTTNHEGKTITTGKIDDEHQAKMDKAVDFLEKITQKPDTGAAFVFNQHQFDGYDRAFYRDTSGRAVETGVFLAKSDGVPTAVHEIGHHIEYSSKNAQNLANEFLDVRLAKSKTADVKMADKFPGHGYMDSEYGNEDGFGKLFGDGTSKYYAGKRYAGGATEVISMGLEMLYADPVKMARDDPEYFKFIIGVTRGIL